MDDFILQVRSGIIFPEKNQMREEKKNVGCKSKYLFFKWMSPMLRYVYTWVCRPLQRSRSVSAFKLLAEINGAKWVISLVNNGVRFSTIFSTKTNLEMLHISKHLLSISFAFLFFVQISHLDFFKGRIASWLFLVVYNCGPYICLETDTDYQCGLDIHSS